MAPTNQQAKASKAKVLAGGKAPKARVQRYLKSTSSQLKEGAKATLLLRGTKCSQAMGQVLKDLRAMQAPHARLLTKKNQIFAFDTEGQMSLEFLTTKNDCALFALASHNKKRPNNLVIGRTFDRQILDQFELGVTRFKSMDDYGGTIPKKRIGSKPLLLFLGDAWQTTECTRRLQSMLTDFYRGDPVDKLVVSGLDHIMTFTMTLHENSATQTTIPTVHQRTYYCKLKKNPSGDATPVPFLTPCGPDLDLVVRRDQLASEELWRASLKQPSANKAKRTKNQTTNIFGETIGRLHMDKQDMDKLQGRKSKALRRAAKLEAEEDKAAVEKELQRETEQQQQELQRDFGISSSEA